MAGSALTSSLVTVAAAASARTPRTGSFGAGIRNHPVRTQPQSHLIRTCWVKCLLMFGYIMRHTCADKWMYH